MLKRSSQKKKAEDKRKELQAFIDRFSANASKSKQATSRKKMLEKITVDQIHASSRKYPGIIFNPERAAGKQILNVQGLSYEMNGITFFKDLSFDLNKDDKIAILSKDSLALNYFYKIMEGKLEATSGEFTFGQTITPAYLPNENSEYFTADNNLLDWLRQFSEEKDEVFIRGFLGKMLFSGEEVFKTSNVLSGGEKVKSPSKVLHAPKPLNSKEGSNIKVGFMGGLKFSTITCCPLSKSI